MAFQEKEPAELKVTDLELGTTLFVTVTIDTVLDVPEQVPVENNE